MTIITNNVCDNVNILVTKLCVVPLKLAQYD